VIITIPTGSQMDRIVRCPASAALPQVYDANEAPDRDRGTAMHSFLDRVAEVGREAALAEADEQHREFLASIALAQLGDRLSLSREVALAYDWRDDTARRLRPLEHRAYEVDPAREIPLTIDLAGVGEAEVYAGDYKSGHGWLPAPEQSMQLGLGALALARLHEATQAEVEYVRVRDDGTPRFFRARLDVFGLEAAAERVRGAMEGVEGVRGQLAAGAVPSVTEGPWCRYCPARSACPAKTALIRQVIADPQPVPYSQPLTPDGARRAYDLWRRARDAMAQVEAALYAYAKHDAIDLDPEPDGTRRVFGELRRPGNEVLAGDVVHRVLTELYGGEVANAAVTMEASKRAITDAIRPALPAGDKITHHTERVFELVRARGGASRPETCTTTEYTIAPDGAARARKRRAG